MSATTRHSFRNQWLLLFVILLAFALRVYRLEHHNIWGDEAFSIQLSKQPLAQAISGPDSHPPLYPILLNLWLPLAGSSPFATRYLSVMAGVLLVSGIYITGRRIDNHKMGLVASILTAISPFAVYYSQETRMYAWAATFSTLSVYSMLRLFAIAPARSRRPTRWHVAFLLSTLAAIYTHYFAFFVLLAQNVYALWSWRRSPRQLVTWIIGQGVLALAYLPWVPFLLAQNSVQSGKAQLGLQAFGLNGMREVWVQTMVAFGIGTTVPRRAQWLALAMIGLVMVGLVLALKRQKASADFRRPVFLASYLIVPVVLAWLLRPLTPFFSERHLIMALPAYLLLMTMGLLAAEARHRLLLVVGLLFVAASSAFALRNYFYDPAYAKGGYGDLMAFIRENAQPGDALYLENANQIDLYNYYAPQDIAAYWFPLPDPWDHPRTLNTLEETSADHNRLWLVMFGNPAAYDPGHQLENWLSRNAFRAYHGDYVDGGLSLYIVGDSEPTQPIEANFQAVIGLTAYGLSSTTVSAGDTLQLSLAWQSLAAMDVDYTIFMHLIDDQLKIWGQLDSQPQGGTHPTSQWATGERVVDRFALQLDTATPPGDYWIQVGWYDATTLERLSVLGADGSVLDERVLLVAVRVEQP